MNEAAKATRRYYIEWDDCWRVIEREPRRKIGTFATEAETQAECDRLNLVAVLQAIRDPSEAMRVVGEMMNREGHEIVVVFPAMIDALISETRGRK